MDKEDKQYARNLAENILEKDPNLESEINHLLRDRLKVLFERKMNWGRIG